MFNKANLSNVGGLSQAQTIFTYSTNDSVSTVVSSGYFDEARGTFNEDDYVFVKSDRDVILRISSPSIPITSSVICDLAGQMPYESFQYVSSINDLPTAVAGVITLEANKVYYFCGDIDLQGDRIVCGQNVCILGGSSENASITSTGLSASQYLIYTDYTLPIRHITIKNVTKAVGVNSSDLANNIALDWTGVNFSGCDINLECGDITNWIFSKGAVLSGGSFVFNGETGTIGVDNSLFVGTGAAENLFDITSTAVITRRFRIIYSSFVCTSSTVGINVDSSATINNQSYILDTCNFSGGGTYLTGVGNTDNKSLFINNVGISNSSDISQYYMNGNATATTILATNTPVKIAGTTTSASVTSKFTNSSNRATYIGALSRYFLVVATVSVQSGNNNQVGIYVAKNGTVIDESEVYGTTNGAGRAENIVVQTLVFLTANDYVEIFAENSTAIQDITATDMNVVITSG